MPRILITYAIKDRDEPIMERIASQIKKLSTSSQVYVVDYVDPHFYCKLLEFEPEIILAFAIQAISVGENFTFVKYLFDNKLVCYSKEGIFNPDSDFDITWYSAAISEYDDNLVDYNMHWGPLSNKLLGDKLVKSNRLKSGKQALVTGYVPYENYFNGYLPKPPSEFTRKTKEFSQTYLFASSFGECFLSTEEALGLGDCLSKSDANFDESLKVYESDKKNALEFYAAFEQNFIDAAKKHTDSLFVIKPHPVELHFYMFKSAYLFERIDQLDNVLVLKEPTQMIDLINCVDVFFHIGSTTQFEAYISKKISCRIKYNKIKENKNHFTYERFAFPSTHEIDAENLESIIARHKANELSFKRSEKLEKYLFDFFNLDLEKVRNGSMRYCPSEDIAGYVLNLPQITHITEDNAFLNSSANGSFGLKFIQNFVMLLKKHLNDDEKFKYFLNYFRKFMNLITDQGIKDTFTKLEEAFSAHEKEAIAMALTELCLLQVCEMDFYRAIHTDGLKTALFGTGDFGQLVCRLLKAVNFPVYLFFDNDEKKQNQYLDGIRIVKPSKSQLEEIDFVLVCSMYYEEISEQLLNLGYCGDKIIKCAYSAAYSEVLEV